MTKSSAVDIKPAYINQNDLVLDPKLLNKSLDDLLLPLLMPLSLTRKIQEDMTPLTWYGQVCKQKKVAKTS